jgi:hypothetical protein
MERCVERPKFRSFLFNHPCEDHVERHFRFRHRKDIFLRRTRRRPTRRTHRPGNSHIRRPAHVTLPFSSINPQIPPIRTRTPPDMQERAVFVREHANGLYTPGAYIANTISVTPFLFLCTLLFALISCVPSHIISHIINLHTYCRYWATAFFRFLFYIFLG